VVNINEKAHRVAIDAYAPWHGPENDIAAMRAGFDRMLPDPAPDVLVSEAEVGGVAGRWVEVPQSGATCVLYLHGGGGVLGSSFAYRDLASRIARAARARVFVADFALAPEHPFPAGFDDARAAYSALLDEKDVDPRDLVVVGDSAGGGIAVALVAALGEWDLPRPACVVALGPFADLTISGNSMTELADIDPLVTREASEQMSAAYLAGHDPKDPKVSAIFADFTDFPPLLVDVGECEVLLDDSRRIVEAVNRHGGKAELHVGEGLIHVYQMFAGQLPEAQESIDGIGEFIARHTR
jgi:acetyl esterase/lipase